MSLWSHGLEENLPRTKKKRHKVLCFSTAQGQLLSVMEKQNGIWIWFLQSGEKKNHLLVAFENQLPQMQKVSMFLSSKSVMNRVSRNVQEFYHRKDCIVTSFLEQILLYYTLSIYSRITGFTLFTVLTAIKWTCVLQEPSDAVNSLSLRVDIGLTNPGSSPVLDIYSPTSVAYSVSIQPY